MLCALSPAHFTDVAVLIQFVHDTAQAELDNGASVRALRRFNNNLRNLPAQGWGALNVLRQRIPAIDVFCQSSAWWHVVLCQQLCKYLP